MKNYSNISLSLIAIIFLLAACNPTDPVVSEFRGPDRNGTFDESNLMKSWLDQEPKEVFYADSIGDGYGSPVIAEDLLYITGTSDSTAVLYCYDLSGNLQWTVDIGYEWVKNYPGSRSAPTVVDDMIYVANGKGDLYCINRQNQEITWSKSLAADFSGVLPRFGHSESPVVYGDLVFWTAGGPEYNVVAINRFTGYLAWSSKGMGERSAYNHPRVITTPSGRTVLITFSAYHLMGFDAQTGELLWTHEQDNYPPEKRGPGYGDTHANTVIYDNGNIYYAAGDGNCGVKLSLSDDGSTINELWRSTGFDSYMGGIVKIGGQIYGSGTAKPQLRSIDALDGTIIDSLKIGRGVVVSADGMLYFYSQTGKIHLIETASGYFKDKGTIKITKGTREHFSHPYIYKGILYVRRGNSLMGFDISTTGIS